MAKENYNFLVAVMWKIHIKRIIAIIFSLGSLYALCGVVTAFVSMFKEV